MLTKNVTEELEAVLQALHDEGKTPSIALVKARLSTPVPMPALISTIKSWKSVKRVPKVEIAANAQPADKIAQLEQQIAALTERVSLLEAQLSEKS